MASFTKSNGSINYSYDAFDVRVSGIVSGTSSSSSYVWDRLPDNPVLLDDGVHAYIHGGGPQAQIDGSGTRYDLLRDALGSVRGLADGSGALVGTNDYDAFGAIRVQSGTTGVLGYPGEQYTAATGLLHLRARDLNPALGRFLSVDTVRPNAPGSQGYNVYAYVANNPTTLRLAQDRLRSRTVTVTYRAYLFGNNSIAYFLNFSFFANSGIMPKCNSHFLPDRHSRPNSALSQSQNS